MKYIPPLTGLRGIAALIVFLSHATNEGMLPWVFGRGFGQIGVMIFFVLSGFLMTYLYARRDFNAQAVRVYAVARIARVVPLYIALLLISVVVSNFIDASFYYDFDNPGRIIRAALFIDAPYVFWTIPVEMQFYVVFIGFWWLVQRRVNPAMLFAFAAATMLPSIMIYFAFDHKTPKIVSYYSYGFFIGAGTALIYDRLKANESLQKCADILGVVMLALIFVNLPAVRERGGPSAFIFIDNTYVRTWLDPVSWIVVYGLVLCAVLNARSLTILNWRPIASLGAISYGFYLMHYPILVYAGNIPAHPLLQCMIAFAGTVLCAYISLVWFETPLGNCIRRWGIGRRHERAGLTVPG